MSVRSAPVENARLSLAIMLVMLLVPLPVSAGASAPPAPESGEAQVDSENLCFGGLEDGKIIVGEQFLKNPYKETTGLGCEVDGGSPVTMPDLPAPDAAKTRLA
ncbi:MAG: hypothetical protein P8Y69_11555 [Gammaproteobacteria bacterium]